MALYPAAVKRLIPPGATDPKITPRVAILHVDAGNANGEDLFRYFSGPSGGIESHFHIQKDGAVYQYRDTAYQADANWHANDFAVSIETQGLAAGEWTAAQLASIKALLLWLNKTHKIPLVKCPRWNGSGVGYHILFMQEWAGGPRACPGPDRIKQFSSVLVPWMSTALSQKQKEWWEMPIPQAELDQIVQAVWTHGGVKGKSIWATVVATYTTQTAQAAALKALAESKNLDAAAIQKAIDDAVSAALADLKITLAPQETP